MSDTQIIPADIVNDVILQDGVIYIRETARSNFRVMNLVSRLKRHRQGMNIQYLEPSKFQDMLDKQSADTGYTGEDQPTSTTIEDAKRLFSRAAAKGASDIHIRGFQSHGEVLFRVNGSLMPEAPIPAEYARSLMVTIYQAMADVADTQFKPGEKQDARLAKRELLPTGVNAIRVACAPHAGGHFMVLRLLYESTSTDDALAEGGESLSRRLSRLGFSAEHVTLIKYMLSRTTGIVVISGPTGSGKSTTLKHVLEHTAYKHPDLHILSVEDPVEYPISGVVQMPVTAEIAASQSKDARKTAMQDAIRHAMRCDPDWIMVGEVRDPESAHLTLQAAMTGHKVLTTLHANNAFGIVNRLRDLLGQISDFNNPLDMLCDESVLTGLIHQSLVKTLCPKCKKPLKGNLQDFDPEVLSRLSSLDRHLLGRNVCMRGEGCEHCGMSGVSGRTVLAEVITPDPQMLETIRKNGTQKAKRYWQQSQKGRSLHAHALEKILQGEVDPTMVEDVIGPITYEKVVHDGRIDPHEVAMLVVSEQLHERAS